MRFTFTLLAFFISNILFSQEEYWKEASRESQAYHDLRLKITTPPYGLSKIKEIIKSIKYSEGDESDDGEMKLEEKKYQKLSLREKFTYNMIHPESYSQICDAMPPIQDEQKKIFGYLPDDFDEYNWSERQTGFFKNNKDSVIVLMTESIKRTGKVGLNYKQVIVEIEATRMIPLLTETYKNIKGQKDLDILTIFMMLMKENEYKSFLESASYKKLYGDETNYEAYLNYNKANEDLIIQRATEFYYASKK